MSEEVGESPEYIVAVGASAGGLEAIESFFRNIPEDTPFGFVVIQHLSPDYKSLMVEILSKKTPLPVFRADDGMTVHRGAVYLIPPRKNLSIYHGSLILSEQDHTAGINLPIDIFLRSVAEDQGDRAIAVILSGTGSDGTRGVRSVKEHGGIIVVQDTASAKFDGMPSAALATGLADFVLTPEEMAGELLAFTSKPRPVSPDVAPGVLTDSDGLDRVFELLRNEFKVDFSQYKRSTVGRRIDRRMTINQVDNIREYALLLERVPAELQVLFRELLIGVTSFFRDPHIFRILEDTVVPELVSGTGRRELRIWVAGCSTGEEAYSVAIILREAMDQIEGKPSEVKIFATDIDRNAIHFAAHGTYPESIAADVPEPYLSKYFYKRDDHFQIARVIREMVVFAPHNLVKDPPFTKIDMVTCRNLLIYLQPEAQTQVLKNFGFSLAHNGVLFLGSSETIGEATALFEPVDAKGRIFRALGTGKVYQGPTSGGVGDTLVRDMAVQHSRATRRLRAADEAIMDRFVEGIAPHYLPTAVIVNEQREVVHIVGDAGKYFRFPSGRPSMELEKVVVKGLSVPLSTGVQKVFRSHSSLSFTGVNFSSGDTREAVDIRIVPLADRPHLAPLVAVLISEIGAVATVEETADSDFDLSEQTQQRIDNLEQELQFTRESLQATIEELETTNEELQASNEELMASNEELQSTNEELQSTNEELYTVNTEYQGKIVELTELTNDIDNLLESSGIGTIILDEDSHVRRFSPEATRIFRLRETDVGYPIGRVTHNLDNFDPVAAIEEVQQTEVHREWPVCVGGEQWYLFRVIPYRVGPDQIAGVVVSVVEITELRQGQHQLDESRERYKKLLESASAIPWEYDVVADRWTYVAPQVEHILGFRADEWTDLDFWNSRLHEDDQGWARDYCIACSARGESHVFEYRFFAKNGEIVWIRDVVDVEMEDGRPVTLRGFMLDISDWKQDAP